MTYVLSRIAEEFRCRPSEAYEELMILPVGCLFEVIEARHYAHAKALTDAWDAARVPKDQRQTGPMFDLVQQIEADIVREARARE